MTLQYKAPQQLRAEITEQRFLMALAELLKDRSLGLITIDEIALEAGLTRSAFLKRFRAKNQAAVILYEKFSQQLTADLKALETSVHSFNDAQEACFEISKLTEQVYKAHQPANRAMQELLSLGQAAPAISGDITSATVHLLQSVQKQHLRDQSCSDVGATGAAQLIQTVNLNYALSLMPGLPKAQDLRHKLIASMALQALKF